MPESVCWPHLLVAWQLAPEQVDGGSELATPLVIVAFAAAFGTQPAFAFSVQPDEIVLESSPAARRVHPECYAGAARFLPRCEASEAGENLRTFFLKKKVAAKIVHKYNTPGAGKTLASRHQALATTVPNDTIRPGGPTRTSADVSVPRLAGFSMIT